jgi:uncharacterized protein YndB with AHSA1/START domain
MGEGNDDFVMELTYDVPVGTLYEQFASADGVGHWWTRDCDLAAEVGGTGSFRFPEVGFFADVRVTRLEPERCVEWHCTDSKHPESTGFADLRDWIGTTIRFETTSLGPDKSRLRFTHVGLGPLECRETCSSLWSYYLNTSLRQYFETGEGKVSG